MRPPADTDAPQLAARRGAGDVVVDHGSSDDAAVVRMRRDGDVAAVMTVDVITPLVDDPECFGAIAACNALSDVYAMGGTPRFALNLVFFPDDELPLWVLRSILAGAQRTCDEAGVALVGGHSVRDAELKFGLSVTGEVAVDAVLSNAGARAGQALVLTKALGTGVLTTAYKRDALADEAGRDAFAAAVASMTRLNADALRCARAHDVTACTDVTGFGLLGHLRNILRGSQLTARLEMGRLPLLPRARELAAAGFVPGGSRKNLEFLDRPDVAGLRRRGSEDPSLTALAADAQTSGGLLLCVDAAAAADLRASLRASGHAAEVIGELRTPQPATPAGVTVLDFTGTPRA